MLHSTKKLIFVFQINRVLYKKSNLSPFFPKIQSNMHLASSSSSSSCTENVSKELPEDVVMNIVRRLPCKDLIRFTITCKYWLSTITSPQFWAPKKIPNFYLFQYEPYLNSDDFEVNHSSFALYNTTHSLKEMGSRIGVPVKKNLSVVCSGSGLICFFDIDPENLIVPSICLFNPCIRKSVIVSLPNPHIVSSSTPNMLRFIFGCGYHSNLGDYKVVRVEYFNGDPGGSDHVSLLTWVYSVKECAWTCLGGVCSLPLNILIIRYRGELIEGVYHWSCAVKVGGWVKHSILTLKLGNDDVEFGEIKMPSDPLLEIPKTLVRVARFNPNDMCGKEMLAVVYGEGERYLSVWTMNDYWVEGTWFKRYVIWLGELGFRGLSDDMNVLFLKQNVVLLQTITSGWTVFFISDAEEQQSTLLPIQENFYFVDNHVESTVLLGPRQLGQCSYGNSEC